MNKSQLNILVKRERETCAHFTGIQNDACAAGVAYSEMRDVSGPGMARWPCLPGHRPCATVCERRELPTEEQAIAKIERLDKAVDAAIARINAGQCPECGKAIEPSQVVGRCKYGACGHRIGQVLDGGDE